MGSPDQDGTAQANGSAGRRSAMLDRLFGTHAENLQNALGKTTRRQSMLMANMANVNVPGYKRQDVDFSISLATEMNDGANTDGSGPKRFEEFAADSMLNSGDDSSIRVDKNSVDVEREVMSIAETDLRFKALTQMTGSYFSGLKNVIREGR